MKFLFTLILSGIVFSQTVTFTSKVGKRQFFARNTQDSAVVQIAGQISNLPGDSASVTLTKNGQPFKRLVQYLEKTNGTASFSFAPTIHAELASYRLDFKVGDSLILTADSLLCGDAFMVEGQSNAAWSEVAYSTPWIRTFGSPTSNTDSTWTTPDKNPWGLFKHIIEQQRIPVFFLNGAAPGTVIEVHMRDTVSVNSIYRRIYWRLTHAGLKNGIKAIFWHQGEGNGQDSTNATSGYVSNFSNLYNSWKLDFPSTKHVFVYQVRPSYCSHAWSDYLRETQRKLSLLHDDIHVIATAGLNNHDGCHYSAPGYQQMGDWMIRLVNKHVYNSTDTIGINSPNIKDCWYSNADRTRMVLQFDQAIQSPIDTALKNYIYLDRKENMIDSLINDPAKMQIIIVLKNPSKAKSISYTPPTFYPGKSYYDGSTWHYYTYKGPWLFNSRGVGAFTFCAFPIRQDSVIMLDTLRLDFFASATGMKPADPVVRIENTGTSIPALTATPDSSWLMVSITGTGNSQVIHHNINRSAMNLLTTQIAKVQISAPGYRTLAYTVVVRPSEPLPVRLVIKPAVYVCSPNGSARFSVTAYTANNTMHTGPFSLVWGSTSGGTIDSTRTFHSNGTAGTFSVRAWIVDNEAIQCTAQVVVASPPVPSFIRRINFQVTTTPYVAGDGTVWLADNGSQYSTATGYGWIIDYGSAYKAQLESRDARAGTNFLLKSYVKSDNRSPYKIKAPIGDYLLRIGLGDNIYGITTPNSAVCNGKTICYKPAGVGNAIGTDTVSVTDTNGLFITIQGAANYLVLVSSNGIPMDSIANDLYVPVSQESALNNGSNEFRLSASPNPSNPISQVSFTLPEAGNVRLAVFDLSGRVVKHLTSATFAAGTHALIWNGTDHLNRKVSTGLYIYKLTYKNKTTCFKTLLSK